jgi:hypothetical protein
MCVQADAELNQVSHCYSQHAQADAAYCVPTKDKAYTAIIDVNKN